MNCRVSIVALLVVVMTLAAACRNEASKRAASKSANAVNQAAQNSQEGEDEHEDEKYHYSPFVVKLEGGRFDTVSFKDVGLDRESPEANDPLLEVISESLAYQLSHHDALGYDARVVYDEEILKPSSHLYCGINHLYVDVWHSPSPDRWGFSLWSGCSELDNFAWKEVPDTAPNAVLLEQVEPLTAGIAEALAEAAQSNCFQKTC